MATKAAEAEDQEQPQAEPTDGPVLDMSDAAVKKLIKTAKARGFVTYDELNEVLPSEEVSSEQIEDTMSMLSDMGINVIDTDEAEEPAEGEAAAEAGREAMIAGLCESPLTFQAIIIWRDELNEGKILLRDIIDLEATYQGPDAKPTPSQPLPGETGAGDGATNGQAAPGQGQGQGQGQQAAAA